MSNTFQQFDDQLRLQHQRSVGLGLLKYWIWRNELRNLPEHLFELWLEYPSSRDMAAIYGMVDPICENTSRLGVSLGVCHECGYHQYMRLQQFDTRVAALETPS